MLKRILLSNHYPEEVLRLFMTEVPFGFDLVQLEQVTNECLHGAIGEADYLIASGRLIIGEKALKCAHRLQMIARTGVGLDAIDVEALSCRAIPLYVNKGINAISVAEHTLLLILACMKRLTLLDRCTRAGVWDRQKQGVQTRELYGKTVCIIGMGRIGNKVATFLEALGCNILTCGSKEISNLKQLVSCSDIVTLHCPLTPSTAKIINAEVLTCFKQGSVLINTARGGLIDYEALLSALDAGKVAFAGLDVYETEPIPRENAILTHEHVVLTPHIGGITEESYRRMAAGVMHNIACFDKGMFEEIENARVV